MKRSGQHAILNWLCASLGGHGCALNDVRPAYDLRNRHWSGTKTSGRLGASNNVWFFHNYEDHSPHGVAQPVTEGFHDRWYGKSTRRYDLLILRDPFNLFASRIRRGKSTREIWPAENQATSRWTREMFKTHAREYLGETEWLPRLFPISYNRWFSDESYRDRLCGLVGCRSNESAMHVVPAAGSGSSFDGQEFKFEAEKMPVLERWRQYEDSSYFRSIFEDRELLDLSMRIFGHIPGTEALSPEIEELSSGVGTIIDPPVRRAYNPVTTHHPSLSHRNARVDERPGHTSRASLLRRTRSVIASRNP